MAEGKKSFVLYTDLIYTVKKLPKEKQAELFLLILEYVNDLNPKTDDLLLEVAFEPIKRQLKRDLQKYEERAIRSRENGSKGGRPSKNNNLEEPKKPNGLFKNPEEPKKPDNVTVTDNVTDTVTDIINTYTTETAFKIFDKRGLSGRFFSTICSINSIDESEVLKEFEKWKIYHVGNDFGNERSIRNSFSKWMSNYKSSSKTATKKIESKIDWDDLKQNFG